MLDSRRGHQVACHVVLLSDALLVTELERRGVLRLITLVWLRPSHLVDGSVSSTGV